MCSLLARFSCTSLDHCNLTPTYRSFLAVRLSKIISVCRGASASPNFSRCRHSLSLESVEYTGSTTTTTTTTTLVFKTPLPQRTATALAYIALSSAAPPDWFTPSSLILKPRQYNHTTRCWGLPLPLRDGPLALRIHALYNRMKGCWRSSANRQGRAVGTSMAPSALAEVGMIELLECDSRPTFVLDLEQPRDPYDKQLHPVFSNASLQRLSHVLEPAKTRRDNPANDEELEQYSQFKEWATSSPTYDHTADIYPIPYGYQSLSWTSSTLRKRWRIISGFTIGVKETSPDSGSSPLAYSQKGNRGISTRSRERLDRKENGKLQASLHPTWVDDLPISEHVQFFKSTDWSATALGPLDSWSVCLRQMTRFLMSDSRAASMFWYKHLVQ